MKKLVSLGTTIFIVGSSFFPDSFIFILGMLVLMGLISFFFIRLRLHLMAQEPETLSLIIKKIVFELLAITPIVVGCFLFIDVDYRWAFVVVAIIMLVIQILKIAYTLYDKKNQRKNALNETINHPL